MHEVAGLYKDEEQRRRYLNAAARFRLPFWDPCMPRNQLDSNSKLKETIFGVPEILRAKTVFVKHWDETEPEEMANPLQSFSFPSETTLEAKGRLTWTESDWMRYIQLEDNSWVQVPRVVSNDSAKHIWEKLILMYFTDT